MKILLLKVLEQKKHYIKRIEMPEICKDPYLWAALDLGWKFYKNMNTDPLWYLSTHNVKRVVISNVGNVDENEEKLKGDKI